MWVRKILLVAIFILLLPGINADKIGHIALLAVSDVGNTSIGSIADLYLEIVPGQGRVFLDTFPLTKLDTQISTRFAKEIACDYYDIDCSRYDFIYTIRANSPIVGGPSAGTAVAVLTSAVLLGKELDQETAVTGTINSGGVIGPVSGIKEKIGAVASRNITKVLIPKGTRFLTLDAMNISLEPDDLAEYGNSIGVEVIESATLADAVGHFTGYWKKRVTGDIVLNEGYSKTMKLVSYELCNRTEILINSVNKYNSTRFRDGLNLTYKGRDALLEKKYYTAASYCFGANVRFNTIILNGSNLFEELDLLRENLIAFKLDFNSRPIETITDLQTYIIVNERLLETKDVMGRINRSDDFGQLSYATERFQSAVSWSKFFGTGAKILQIDQGSVHASCISKLREAEERYSYANLLYPNFFDGIRQDINEAYALLGEGDYAFCLFKASKAKARSDVFLGMIGSTDDQIVDMIYTKLEAIQEIILEQESFPILGYSYYEYARSLAEDDKYSALLYTELSLELSDQEMYFKKTKRSLPQIRAKSIQIFFFGAIIGAIAVLGFRRKTLGRSHLRKTSRGKKR